MAAFGANGQTLSTSNNATSYPFTAFAPSVGDLLVLIVVVSGSVAAGSVTDDQNGTWTKAGSAVKNSSADTLYCFVRDQLVTSTANITVTMGVTGDAGTGCSGAVHRITGMLRAGPAAIRQFTKQDNQAGGGTPAPVFGVSCLTGNLTLVACANAANPAALTPNASWSEKLDSGHGTPTTGIEISSRDSGFTGTTVTFGGTSASAFCTLAIELDASAEGTRMMLSADNAPIVSPSFQSSPTHSGSAIRRMMAPADGSSLGTVAHTPDSSSDHTVAGTTLAAQLLGPPMATGTIFANGDAFELAVQALEAVASNNLFLRVAVYVISLDGTTLRATIRSAVDHAAEMNTSLRSLFLASTLDASYTTQHYGDRLMVEILGSGTPTATGSADNHNWSLRLGMSGTAFLARNDNADTATTKNPWIEFARVITFVQPTILTLVEEVWRGTPAWNGGSGKDRNMRILDAISMMQTYRVSEAPRTVWNYSGISPSIYGNLLKYLLGYTGDTADLDTSTIIQSYFDTLFAPVGFEDGVNWTERGRRACTISARDVARFMWLVLNRGNWNGSQVISSRWFPQVWGSEGLLFGQIHVPQSLARTAGAADAGNYMDAPSGAMTDYDGGGDNQHGYGPGLFGGSLFFNGLDGIGDGASGGAGTRAWPDCPLTMFCAVGENYKETHLYLPDDEIVCACIKDGGLVTWPQQDGWNDIVAALRVGITTPSYAAEFPGASWTAAASDAAAGMSTSALDTFLALFDHVFLARRGRQVRTKGTFSSSNVGDWSSAGKSILVATLLTKLTPPSSLPLARRSMIPTFLR